MKGIEQYSYKYIEKVLYQYENNIEKIEVYKEGLRELLLHGDVTVQAYKMRYGGSDITDRVFEYVHRKDALEKKIKRLEIEIQTVKRLKKQLSSSESEHEKKLQQVLTEIYILNGKAVRGMEIDEQNKLRQELVRRARYIMKGFSGKILHKRYCERG